MDRSSKRALGTGAAIAAMAACLAVALPASAQNENAGATYRATLLPLNNSGAHGQATVTLKGRALMVHITASGLEPGGAHLAHIHGLSRGNAPVDSTCPTSAQDSDGDGFVELAEGAATYGPILVDFMNIDPDQDGNVDFTTTVELSGNEAAIPLNKRHIVVHGRSVGAVGAGTPGEVDGTAGYKTVLPVLCGELGGGAKSDAMRFRTRG